MRFEIYDGSTRPHPNKLKRDSLTTSLRFWIWVSCPENGDRYSKPSIDK